MSYTYEVFIIKVDGRVEYSTQTREPPLEQLQRAVGGYIQEVPHLDEYAGRRVKAYANEEGKLHRLPRNEAATQAWLACLGDGPFSYDPVLHGDVVVFRKEEKG
jgi:hypothetical protein